jgi:hypothetical protein
VKSAAQKTEQAGSARLIVDAQVADAGQTIGLHGNGAYDVNAHDGSLNATFDAGAVSGAVEEVLKGTDVYLKSDLFALALPAGKTWLKVDLAKAAKSKGLDLRSLLDADPSTVLKALESQPSATKVGSATIDGTATTEYSAGPYDVWVGSDGYNHQLKATISAGATAGGKVSGTVTTQLSSFGAKVSVTVPPAASTYAGTTASIPGLGG